MKSTLMILLLALSSRGAEPPLNAAAGMIRMPPALTMAATPSSSQKLTIDLNFVVDSDVPVMVLCSPDGIVKITKESGPLKIRGKFIDDPTKTVTKTFSGKYIFSVEAAKTGKCEIIVIPGIDDETKVIRRTLNVEAGEAPRPPPTPVDPVIPPDPVPVPTTNTGLIAGDGLRVLITYDALKQASYTQGQRAAISGKTVRDYLKSHCASEGPATDLNDGKAYRIWTIQEDASGAAKAWQDAFARPRTETPWAIISNPKFPNGGWEGPLKDDFLDKLKKYGGD